MDKETNPAAREIGVRISRWIGLRGMTQHELSIQADIPEESLSRIISGKRMPSTENLLKIAGALRVPLSAFQTVNLDQYGFVPADLMPLIEALEKKPASQRKKLLETLAFMMEKWADS